MWRTVSRLTSSPNNLKWSPIDTVTSTKELPELNGLLDTVCKTDLDDNGNRQDIRTAPDQNRVEHDTKKQNPTLKQDLVLT